MRQRWTLWMMGAALCLLGASCSDNTNETGTGNIVDTNKGYGDPCEQQVNCRSGLTCTEQEGGEESLCLPEGTTAAGERCTLTAECAEDLFCDSSKVCAEDGGAAEGAPCAATADCQAGLLCGLQGFELVCQQSGELDIGEACGTAADCLAGLGCVGGACVAGGEPCEDALQCGGRMCVSGFCSTGADVPMPEIYTGVTCEEDIGPLRVLFEVPREGEEITEFYGLPFPNDARLKDGAIDLSGHPTPPLTGLSGPLVQRILDMAMAELDGWGQNPAILFRFSSNIDLESLKDAEDNQRFRLLDLSAWQAEPTEAAPAIGVSWSAASGRGSRGLYICDNWLGMRVPWGRPLKPSNTYAALVFKGINGERGEAERDADFEAMLADTEPSDPELAHAYEAYAPLRTFLASDAASAQGILASDVIGATVFTTQSTEKSVPLLRDAVRAQPEPALSELTLCDGDTVSPCDDGLEGDEHTRGCMDVSEDFYELHAKVSLPSFQQGEAPYFSVEDGGAFNVDANGSPSSTGSHDVCVSITVPKSRAMPETGWPVVVYAHGTSGDFRSQINNGQAALLSNLTATDSEGAEVEVGAITIGFDAISHGPTRGSEMYGPQTLYFNFTNPQAARGNVFQGVADIFTLTRLAEGIDVAAEDSPTTEAILADVEKLYLMAHSQGTNYGAIALPHEPNLKAAVLSGAGGGFILSTLNKTEPVDIASGIKLAFSDPNIGDFHPVLNIAQMYIDGADPVNYGQSILIEPEADRCDGEGGCDRPQIFHAYGVDDNYTPEISQQALAVSMGSYLIQPAVQDFGGVVEAELPISGNFGGDTAFVRQYLPDQDYDGHFVLQRHPEAIGDLQEFMGTLIVDGVPTVE